MAKNVDRERLLHQPLSRTASDVSNTLPEPEPEPEPEPQPDQQGSQDSTPGPQPEPNLDTQETQKDGPQPKTEPPLSVTEYRIQQLQNRLQILQNAQEVRRKSADGGRGEPGSTAPEDGGNELEEVLQELEELEKHRRSDTATKDQKKASYVPEMPHGGIYILPQLHPAQDGGKPQPTEDQVVPADRLERASTATRCPSCGRIVYTRVQSARSEAMWLMCCLMASLGCVAGCCLIPFCINSMKKVHHRCPGCEGSIHTYRPF